MAVALPVPDMEALAARLRERFEDPPAVALRSGAAGELTLTVETARLTGTLVALRDEEPFAFDQLVDLCGLDYSAFAAGYGGLYTQDAFVVGASSSAGDWQGERFAVVYHLLSVTRNYRLRVRSFLADEELPTCPSANTVWPAAQWYEREAFDLFGIAFTGHPDLRRLLTDYGFIGHPFRKDFPVEGKVEMRYDPGKGRVVYQPVTITPREVVPRIRRADSFGAS